MHETIFVLGLGETLKFFQDYEAPKIGVNDIWSKVQTEMVVCIDRPEKFDTKRRQVIENSKPAIFFSYMDTWRKTKPESFYWKNKITALDLKTRFSDGEIYHSNNSPFVAANIAYLLGAKSIVLYGVDFLSHSKLKGYHTISKILKDFEWLKNNFKERGVNLYVGHRASKLNDVLELWNRQT